MTLSLADIARWDAQAVRDVFHAATRRADSAAQASAALAGLPAFSTWGGVAADAARDAIGKTRVDLDAHADEARTVAIAAQKAADDIDRVKRELRQIEDDAHAACLDIDPTTGRVVPGPGFRGSAAEFASRAGPVQARVDAVIAEANGVDAELAQAISMADGRMPIPQTPAPPPIPPPATTPEDTKKWWDSLSRTQQEELLHDHPEELGSLDGLPVPDRSTANSTVLQHDLDRVTDAAAAHHVSADEISAHPEQYGLSPNDVVRYTNATRVADGLRELSTKTRGAPTYLQIYQPDTFGGQGRAAIAIGNPDTADNTTVVVPGTSNSVPAGWLSRSDAANLYNEAAAADRGRTTSVLAWMGYDAPDSLLDPQVAQTGLAHQGGALLAADVNALNATHIGASHVTVVGHSYGSTTVADAAAGYGMHATDVVLIGCPGTDMAHDAGDFHLAPGGHLYVGSGSADPVTHLGGLPQAHVPGTGVTVALGPDPSTDGFGSTRFKAEPPGFVLNDHSHYYDPGSESLFSMSDIASGHGDALQRHGMTAPHRDEDLAVLASALGVPGVRDTELFRPGTEGNYHK